MFFVFQDFQDIKNAHKAHQAIGIPNPCVVSWTPWIPVAFEVSICQFSWINPSETPPNFKTKGRGWLGDASKEL